MPTIHVGRYANAPERRQHNAEVKAVNHELADARAELAKVAKPTAPACVGAQPGRHRGRAPGQLHAPGRR